MASTRDHAALSTRTVGPAILWALSLLVGTLQRPKATAYRKSSTHRDRHRQAPLRGELVDFLPCRQAQELPHGRTKRRTDFPDGVADGNRQGEWNDHRIVERHLEDHHDGSQGCTRRATDNATDPNHGKRGRGDSKTGE